MKYNKNYNYYLKRETSKKIYYESFKMDYSIGNKIRNLIQKENERNIHTLRKYIENIYEYNEFGGYLQNCLDYEHLNDDDIIWCLENKIPMEKDNYLHSQYYYCAICLLMLSYSKRIKIVKNFKNNKKNKA